LKTLNQRLQKNLFHASNRKLAAIIFTDIIGYSALMAADEQKAFQILNKQRTIKTHNLEIQRQVN
jgi:class 3 adenylate cyclase